MTAQQFRKLALSLENVEENPHFDRAAFKVTGSRIFATLHEPSRTANVKLSPVDQSVFSDLSKGAVYPVPNKWGIQGWTTIELKTAPGELIADAVETAYRDALVTKKRKRTKS